MATGYTHAIKDGLTFEAFVWTCARAFGALIMMRDDPMGVAVPQRFEPSDHYAKVIAEKEAERAALIALDADGARIAAKAAFSAACDRATTYADERVALREKYEAMAASVMAWQVPEPCAQLKEFMLSQLSMSIDHDCSLQGIEPIFEQDPADWMDDRLTELDRTLAYYRKAQAEDIARTQERNDWVAALRASVPQPDARP